MIAFIEMGMVSDTTHMTKYNTNYDPTTIPLVMSHFAVHCFNILNKSPFLIDDMYPYH